MSLPDIPSLVPHGGAMSLLGRLLSTEGESLVAEVAIGPDSMFCTNGSVGAWVGVEYMAQAVAAHAGYAAGLRGEPVRVGFLLGARRPPADRAPTYGGRRTTRPSRTGRRPPVRASSGTARRPRRG